MSNNKGETLVPITDYQKQRPQQTSNSSRFTDFLLEIDMENAKMTSKNDFENLAKIETEEEKKESIENEQFTPNLDFTNQGNYEDNLIKLDSKDENFLKAKKSVIIENEFHVNDSKKTIGVKWSGGRHDNLLEDHLKRKNSTVLPFVKKFMFKLRSASPFKSVSNLKEECFVILNDQSYFYDEMKKAEQIFNAKNCMKNWLIFMKKLDFLLYNFKNTGIFNFFKDLKNTYFQAFHPYGNIKIIWDILHLILIIFWLFYIPLLISFGKSLFLESLEYEYTFLTLSFLSVDVLLHCNTSYFKSGIEEKKRKKIIMNYFKSSFLRDAISITPFFLDFFIFNKKSNLTLEWQTFSINNIHFLKLVFYFKLFSINEIFNRILEKFLLKEKLQNMVALLRILFISVLVAHSFACFFYFTANLQSSSAYETWLSYYNLEDADWKKQYLYSIYWSLITMMTVGYGDISPKNEYETLIAMIVAVFGCGVYAYNINSVGMILQDLNRKNQEFGRNIDLISQFMKRKKINKDLQMRVREYLRYIWQEENAQNIEEEQKIINSLSASLREELLVEAYGNILKNHPMFFANFSETSLRKVVSIIKDIKLIPDENVFLQNEQSESDFNIYFIMKGKIEISFRNNGKHDIFIKRLKVGDHFGELGFFTGQGRSFSVKSKDFTTLLTINRDEFIQILQKTPDDFEKFRMIQDQILLYDDILPLRLRCLSCQQIGHLTSKCPFIHFIADREKVIKQFNFYVDQERELFNRKRKDRINSLTNKDLVQSQAKVYNKHVIQMKKLEKKEHFKKLQSMFQSLLDDSFSEESYKEDGTSRSSSDGSEINKESEALEEDFEKNNESNCSELSSEQQVEKHPSSKDIKDQQHENTCSQSSLLATTKINLKFQRNSAFTPQNSKRELMEEKKKKKHNTTISLEHSKKKNAVYVDSNRKRINKLSQIILKDQPRLSILSNFADLKSDFLPSLAGSTHHANHQTLHNNLEFNTERMVREIIKRADHFEAVQNFKNYFPQNNIKNILEQINQNQTPRLLKYSKSLRERKKSIDYRLSKYTFFPEEMKEKMPDAIKRKALKISASANPNKAGMFAISSNQLNIPPQNNSPTSRMMYGRQTSNPDFKSILYKNKKLSGLSSSIGSNNDKKSGFLKNRFLSGDREKEGEKKILFSDLVNWVIQDPVVKKVIKKGRKIALDY